MAFMQMFKELPLIYISDSTGIYVHYEDEHARRKQVLRNYHNLLLDINDTNVPNISSVMQCNQGCLIIKASESMIKNRNAPDSKDRIEDCEHLDCLKYLICRFKDIYIDDDVSFRKEIDNLIDVHTGKNNTELVNYLNENSKQDETESEKFAKKVISERFPSI